MAETNATILIPDISGFTEFMSTTELDHGSHAINILLDAILKAAGDEYEISEIEGDAVLMFKRGPAPTNKEILDICLKIFNAFHFQRKWMQQHTICPCGACQAIINLTVKFVVHHGPVGEMKVGRFVTLSGRDIIIAHRLLKNSVPSNEYVLITEKLWQHSPDLSENFEIKWSSLSDEFASLGKVDYRFARLETVRTKTPDPPAPENYYRTDNTSHLEMPIAANFRDVYMIVMNIPGRTEWVPGLQKVEQDIPDVFIGSIHHCSFENYQATISPLHMSLTDEGILYAESCRLKETNISLVYEFVFKKINEKNCGFACRILNAGESPVPEETSSILFKNMQQMAEKLKSHCEVMNKSFF
jgi:Protein of unknown function (DUF2652)